jgi:hypothetical protein
LHLHLQHPLPFGLQFGDDTGVMRVHKPDLKKLVEIADAVIGLQIPERDDRPLEREGQRYDFGDVWTVEESAWRFITSEINFEIRSLTEKFT